MKKTISILLILCMALGMFAGCTFKSSKNYTFDLATGDNVKVELSTSDGFGLRQKDGMFYVTYKDQDVLEGDFRIFEYELFTDDEDGFFSRGNNTLAYNINGYYGYLTKLNGEICIQMIITDKDLGRKALDRLTFSINGGSEIVPSKGLPNW